MPRIMLAIDALVEHAQQTNPFGPPKGRRARRGQYVPPADKAQAAAKIGDFLRSKVKGKEA